MLAVVIPRHLLAGADRMRGLRPTLSLPLSTARGALLSGSLLLLWDELSAGRVYKPETVAHGFLGLVDGLITSDAEPPDSRDSDAMERYVRAHLADVTLGVEHLQRAFYCSRSTIYRFFERHGGVAAFIRNERLRRCHAELLRPTQRPVAVHAVAARFGFHDAAHFSRAFREPSNLTVGACRPRCQTSRKRASRRGSRHGRRPDYQGVAECCLTEILQLPDLIGTS